MTYNATGKRIRNENLAGQAMVTDWDCWSVTYNGENRPILWTLGTNTISMSFDRMGRRVTKNNQCFVYNGYLRVANYHLSSTNYQLFVWENTPVWEDVDHDGFLDPRIDKVHHNTGPWSKYKKQFWEIALVQLVKKYFEDLSLTCKRPTDCPNAPCEEVKGRVELKFVADAMNADVSFVAIDTEGHFRRRSNTGRINWADVAMVPTSDRTNVGSNPDTKQIVFLHELGHWLGLVHPGQKLEPGNRPARNSPADYEADYDSLMGRGMKLREDDYNSIFCNHLTW